MPYITTTKAARNLIFDKLVTNQVALGLGYVGKDDERRLPQYPAVVVSAGQTTKELHATHTWAYQFLVFIWVYHANLAVGRRTRTDEDMDLADAIIAKLEEDMTLGGSVIQGWIESQTPGVFQPRANKGDLVIGSRLVWTALSEGRF